MTDRPSNNSEKISSVSDSQEKSVSDKGVTVKKQNQKITLFFQSTKPEKAQQLNKGPLEPAK